jgi:Ca2+-binding EF-hand superfamily protein
LTIGFLISGYYLLPFKALSLQGDNKMAGKFKKCCYFFSRVKSTYVETYDQELFLKNMPKAIDTRIASECPILAKAIAAEHLIQVFHTHGTSMVDSDEATSSKGDVIEQLDDKDKEVLMDAYGQTFDLVDSDGSGTLDQTELIQWLEMCGAELDLTKITDVLLKEGNLTRDMFAKLMSSYATSSRRDYDIGGTIKSSH